MPVTRSPLDAVVSVWGQASMGPDHTPIGSGIFISPQYVLTAKHLITNVSPPRSVVWLGGVKDKEVSIPVTKFYYPTDVQLDIALLELDQPNNRQPWVLVEVGRHDLKGQQVCLYGVLPREKERTERSGCQILAYEEEYRYYLTDYRHTEGFSGGVATLNNVIVGVISARYKTENQGIIIPLSTSGAWLRGFVNLRESIVPPGRTSPPATPITPSPHEAFIHKIRSEIRALLQRPHMQALRDALQQGDGQPAEEVLVPSHPASLIETLDRLHLATESCLQQLSEQPPDRIDRTKDVARKIFGWLAVLAVNREQVQSMGLAFDPRQGGIEVQIPLDSEAGIEVFIASLGERPAELIRKDDSKRGSVRLFGRSSFTADELEMGIGHADQLTEILKCIWVKVMETEVAPMSFGTQEQKRLGAILDSRERRKQSHYYFTVPPAHHHSPLGDREVLTRLRQVLPSLRFMYIVGDQGEGLLFVDEEALWALIAEFLLMLRDTP